MQNSHLRTLRSNFVKFADTLPDEGGGGEVNWDDGHFAAHTPERLNHVTSKLIHGNSYEYGRKCMHNFCKRS